LRSGDFVIRLLCEITLKALEAQGYCKRSFAESPKIKAADRLHARLQS
jgi:hypothetical protein